LKSIATVDALGQLCDGRRLVARRLKRGDDLKAGRRDDRHVPKRTSGV